MMILFVPFQLCLVFVRVPKKNYKFLTFLDPNVDNGGVSRGRSVAVDVGVSDRWQVTCGRWHKTCDMLHVTFT